MPIALTDSNHSTEITSSVNAIIDFYATWCGPCKAMAPFFDAAEKQAIKQKSKIKFYKVDVDNEDCANISQKYRVTCMPTIIFIRNGEIISRVEGAMTMADLTNDISKHITSPILNNVYVKGV